MNKDLTIGEFFKLCLANKAKFAASVAVMLVLAAAYLIVTPPKYTKKAQLLVRDNNALGGLMGQMGGLGELGGLMGLGSSSNVYNELHAMQSPWLLLTVVRQMNLDMSYVVKGIRNKDLYGDDLPVTVKFSNLTDEDDVQMKLDLKKNGEFKIYKIRKNDDKYDDELTGHVNSIVKSSIGDIEVKETRREGVRERRREGEEEEMTITVRRTEPMAVVNAISKSRLTIAVENRDATIIDIKCTDVSKQRATDLINNVIAEYRKESAEDQDAQTAVSERYVTERLISLENELKSLDSRVADYKSKTMMPDLEVMAKVYAESAKDISQAHLELSNQLYVAQSIRDYLRDESKKDELLPALLVTDNQGLADQVSEYNTLQLQRNKIIASSSKESPLVKDIDKQLNAMHDAVLSSAENAIKQLKIQLKSVAAKESEGKQLLASAPKKFIGGLTDERDWKVLNEVYVFLLQKREEAQMTKALKTDVRLLTPPLGEKKQTSPKKGSILVCAFLLGLFIPACWIAVRSKGEKERRREGVKERRREGEKE
jgi:uncharacterized protein involved in exopolysaccharide biosynthesis